MVSTKLQLIALLLFFICLSVSSLDHNFLTCESNSSYAYGYGCDDNESQHQCAAFALLRANSFYSSLYKMSFYLGISRSVLAAANGFSADVELLPNDQPVLIPLYCTCKGGVFGGELTKSTIKGESFDSISEALEGLTTCAAIQQRNPSVNPWVLGDTLGLLVPLRCACPSNVVGQTTQFLLTYPVNKGDTVANLATRFNVTPASILSANNRAESGFNYTQKLKTLSTLLIPLSARPVLGSLAIHGEQNVGYPTSRLPLTKKHKKKSKMKDVGVYIGVSGAAFVAIIAIAVSYFLIQQKKNQRYSQKEVDLELQQLGLSVRPASEKKVSFEGSHGTFDGQVLDATTMHKLTVETYTLEQLRKATEDFSSANLIEDSVFHGRLIGKNLAIKCTNMEVVSKIEFRLFQDAVHHHPNISRLLGTCVTQGADSFLVFEYARNGSLEDWLHGGLAMKSQFIASCYCFLTWNQRLRICLDIATALQYMHHIMNPSYIHRNIKSRNIFIDEEFNAKVGNFGMAGCVENDPCAQLEESCSTHSGLWAKGYMPPECLQQNVPATSTDVFAYGVVLLEVLSGKPPVSKGDEKEEGTILLSETIKHVLESEHAEELREWTDNVLGENYSFDQAVTLANLARACVEDDPCLRPNAGEIVEKLAKLVEELPEGDQFRISESSCKPLVKAAASNNI